VDQGDRAQAGPLLATIEALGMRREVAQAEAEIELPNRSGTLHPGMLVKMKPDPKAHAGARGVPQVFSAGYLQRHFLSTANGLSMAALTRGVSAL